jgi:hypothetical protein
VGLKTELAWNTIIFLLSFFAIFFLVISAGSRVISELRRIRFLRQLTNIYHDFLPQNRNLNLEPSKLPKPIIYRDQGEILGDLITGISKLLGVGSHIRIAYEGGELRMTDFEHLRSSIQNLREIFQQHLVRRIHEYIEGDNPLSENELRHYYTAGYLRGTGYQNLKDCISLKKDGATPKNDEEAPASTRVSSPKIFFSYRRSDSEDITNRLYERLATIYGEDCLVLDKTTIPAGQEFPSFLRREIARSDVFLAMIGDQWLQSDRDPASDWVMIEIATAIELEIPVIPILVGLDGLPKLEELPEQIKALRTKSAIHVRSDPHDFKTDAKKLIRAIEGITSSN